MPFDRKMTWVNKAMTDGSEPKTVLNCHDMLQDYIVAEVAVQEREVAEKGEARERFQASLHTDLLTVYR